MGDPWKSISPEGVRAFTYGVLTALLVWLWTEDYLLIINNNDFLEHQHVYGNMYGSTLESVNTITSLGSDVVLEIDYKGMLAVKRELPHAISVYITPPSIETLKERLLKRGEDTEEVINKRMASSSHEMTYAKYADYMVINDNYDDALNLLKGIILLNRINHRQLSSWANYLNKINNRIV